MTEPSQFGIKISVLTRDGAAPGSGSAAGADFDIGGGTIGSGSDNLLVLADDGAGSVAAHHADIRCVAGNWRMRNVSERGMLTVNGKPLMPGGDVRVGVGDFIGVGPYVLRVAPGIAAPDWQGGATAARTEGLQSAATAARDGSQRLHGEAGPLAGAPSAGWRSDGTTLLESPVAFGDLTDLPVDPLALFGAVERAWPGTQSPQAANLFGEDLARGARIDEPAARAEPRPQPPRQRESTELNRALPVGGATLVPPRPDEVLLRPGANDRPAVAPLAGDDFEVRAAAVAQSHDPAMPHTAGAHSRDPSHWQPVTEPTRVPVKVRYAAQFGVALRDAELHAFAEPEWFEVDGSGVMEMAARAASSGGRPAKPAANAATPVEPLLSADDLQPFPAPRSPAPQQAAETIDDRFAMLRAAFPATGAATQNDPRPAPLESSSAPATSIDNAHAPMPLQPTPEDAASILVRAFFAGLGVAPHEAAAAGLGPELMHALGGLTRTLLGKRSG